MGGGGSFEDESNDEDVVSRLCFFGLVEDDVEDVEFLRLPGPRRGWASGGGKETVRKAAAEAGEERDPPEEAGRAEEGAGMDDRYIVCICCCC